MTRILDDPALKARLIEAGHERSHAFRWRRCAEETMAVLEQVGTSRAASRARRLEPTGSTPA
jgi:glycosyltransferase involved in cell wall biosynthesis